MAEYLSTGFNARVYLPDEPDLAKYPEATLVRVAIDLNPVSGYREYLTRAICVALNPELFPKIYGFVSKPISAADFRQRALPGDVENVDRHNSKDPYQPVATFFEHRLFLERLAIDPDHFIYSNHMKVDYASTPCACDVCTRHGIIHDSSSMGWNLRGDFDLLAGQGIEIDHTDWSDHCFVDSKLVHFEPERFNSDMLKMFLDKHTETIPNLGLIKYWVKEIEGLKDAPDFNFAYLD